jgi:hypothetical protein
VINTLEASLSVEPKRTAQLQKLIDISHDQPIDYLRSLDWSIGVDRSRPPKLPEHGWLYGTEFHERMTPEQQHEVLWLEMARDVTMFLTLERALPALYTGYVTRYEGTISREIYDYLLIFSREEITHTLMFKRYQRLAGLPPFTPDPALAMIHDKLPDMPPAAGILVTLLIEWMAELGAMFATQHDVVDPLTRAFFHRHHVDEVRHIAFGRWIVEAQFAAMPEAELTFIRELARNQFIRLSRGYSFNDEIGRFTSFDYPVQPGDAESAKAIRTSAHVQDLNRQRFAPMVAWLQKVGIL